MNDLIERGRWYRARHKRPGYKYVAREEVRFVLMESGKLYIAVDGKESVHQPPEVIDVEGKDKPKPIMDGETTLRGRRGRGNTKLYRFKFQEVQPI